jgi:hypothetical protein
MNAADLNAKLRALLSTELGVYSNGTPSIWVYGSSSNPPSASNGLECLIRQNPIGFAGGSSAGQRYKPQQWEVVLKNWNKDSNLIKALSKIEQNFCVTSVVHIPFTGEFIEQAKIMIKDPIFV